ncbi:hypothetical protein EYC59_03185 [Candidatus Saccharibacteria bacterium]|nr:MAG: hypothetical protein EYC59_03185 [Candidatus Saccharibacteria bacterium]
MEKPYRQQILDAAFGIYRLESGKTWVTKDADGLYLPAPPMWHSPEGELTIRDATFAFQVLDTGEDPRTKFPCVLNEAKLIFKQGEIEMMVYRTGDDYYQNDFSKDVVLPRVLAVLALCEKRDEGVHEQAA